jgi:membrane-associated protein
MNPIDLFLHLDTVLEKAVEQYHTWIYLILFVIVFCETGLVVTPFLPGDSLLFAAGALATLKPDRLNALYVCLLLSIAAVIGDTLNYWIGHLVGPKVFHKNTRWLNREHLNRAHQFYEKYGGKTIILARFMPIIRTFAPFVAGIGSMTYWKFLTFNVVGGVAWVVGLTTAGYYFGGNPFIKKNFSLVIMAIVILSILPAVIEFVRHRRRREADKSQSER